MFVTKCTFTVGGEKGDKVDIPAGEEVSAKELGISTDDASRYVGLGLLAEKKPKAEKKSADKAN